MPRAPDSKKAKAILNLEDVPSLPRGCKTMSCGSSGDMIYVKESRDGTRRWRYRADRSLQYYFRTQPGAGRTVVPYEEMYRG